MTAFFDTVFSFPTVLFTFLLIVVAAYWLLVVFGGADLDLLDTDVDIDVGDAADGDSEPSGLGGILAALGLQGVPITVSISIIVVVAWFVSLVGSVLVDTFDERIGDAVGDGGTTAFGFGVVALSLFVSWSVARRAAVPLRRVFTAGVGDSRVAFIGRVAVVRTEHVTDRYGQAEVTAEDGSSAVVQVRSPAGSDDADLLVAGANVLLHGYDDDGEFFWVAASELG